MMRNLTVAREVLADKALMRARLDARLFTENGFIVTARNGHGRVSRRNAAVAASMRGCPVAWAGRVRGDVAAVDIDACDARMHDTALSWFRSWCEAHECFMVAAPSGGGLWRSHVFVIFDSHELRTEFRAFIGYVRQRVGASQRQVDDRTDQPIRALSSSHRSGAAREFLLPDYAANVPEFSPLSFTVAERVERDALEGSERDALEHSTPLTRLQRRAIARLRVTGDSSHDSAVVTWRLRDAGASDGTAWRYLQSQPDVFAHAIRRGYAWWRVYQWDKHKQLRTGWPHGVDRVARVEAWRRYVAPMVARVRSLAGDMDVQRRQKLEHVAGVVAARLGAHDGTHHLPERDLHVDTGVSRTTIRAVLRQLVSWGLVAKVAQYDLTLDPATHSNVYQMQVRLVAAQIVPPSTLTPPSVTSRYYSGSRTGSADFSAYATTWLRGRTTTHHHHALTRGLLGGESHRQRALAAASLTRLQRAGLLSLSTGTVCFGRGLRVPPAAAARSDRLRASVAAERLLFRTWWCVAGAGAAPAPSSSLSDCISTQPTTPHQTV